MDVSNITSAVQPARFVHDSAIPAAQLSRQDATASNTPDSGDSQSSSANLDSGANLDAAVADIQSFVQTVKRGLDFNVDDSSGEVVVKVIDTDSGKLVRQIPSEELLRLAERLEDIRSLMFEAKA